MELEPAIRELRQVIKDLAQRVEALEEHIHQENGRLREALAAVEWAEMERVCPWCLLPMSSGKHRPDCQRQSALGITA